MRKTRESVYERRERVVAAIGGADLSARNLAKYGLRRGAYDGATRRRFVLFESGTDAYGEAVEWRHEYDTKAERDIKAAELLREKMVSHT